MWLEAWILKEQEKKKKKLSEKEVRDSMKKQVEFKKTKEKIGAKLEAEDEIFNLRQLVDKGAISKETAQNIVGWKDINDETIKEIFDKIDQIEGIRDIDNILPAKLRVSCEEYFKAIGDDTFRVQILTRLDSALSLIASKITNDSSMALNLFSGFLNLLDKNLIKVQENTIDLKNSLVEVDEKKFWKKVDNRSIWEKIIDFLKDLIK